MTAKTNSGPDEAIVSDVCGELRAHLEIIAARRRELPPGSFDEALAQAAASIGKMLLATSAERRQQSKVRIREIAAIPLDQVVAYLRTLPEAKRQDIAAEITGADAGESLL